MNFLKLEIGYIIIALFFLVITAIVTTRDFMPKGAFKKGVAIVFFTTFILIAIHYHITTKRMNEIKIAFNMNKTILCENKEALKGSHTIVISKKAGWKLENGIFFNPNYYRKFHSARCTVEVFQP